METDTVFVDRLFSKYKYSSSNQSNTNQNSNGFNQINNNEPKSLSQKVDELSSKLDNINYKIDVLIHKSSISGDYFEKHNSSNFKDLQPFSAPTNVNKNHFSDGQTAAAKVESKIAGDSDAFPKSKQTSDSARDGLNLDYTPAMLAEVGVPCPQGWGKTQACSPSGRFEWQVTRELCISRWWSLTSGIQAIFSPPIILPASLNGWRVQIQFYRPEESPNVNMSLWLRHDNYNQTLMEAHLPLKLSTVITVVHPDTAVEQHVGSRQAIVFKKVGMGKVLTEVPVASLDRDKPSIIYFQFSAVESA